MQQQRPPYAAALQSNDPTLSEWVSSGREFIITDGALSAKVKTLMTMLCDALLAHPDGVRTIANRARAMGATEEEIAETIRVAMWMGGLPALVTGTNAYKDE
jgi:alkylhydroperoxidase/carboxymuconolactone decarboxylase family protein YurZ